MNDITRVLSAIDQGDPHAAEQLLPLVYNELRALAAHKIASEPPGRTIQATALVHEAYLRLVAGAQPQHWNGRAHFFAAAAEAMRRILINRARDRQRLKREGGHRRVELEAIELPGEARGLELLAVDEALDRLAREQPACAEVVKLRFFVGLTLEEAADVLGVTRRTADRYWAYARAWLYKALEDGGPGTEPG